IPPPERFFAGSDGLLRGYRYLTVSPLNKEREPIGGRSMLIGAFELRWRLTKKWGLVGFYDIGNVYSQSVPDLSRKQLQSVGVGIRYHTLVGPIRLDVAFPLDRRHDIKIRDKHSGGHHHTHDPTYQIYFSIGQSF